MRYNPALLGRVIYFSRFITLKAMIGAFSATCILHFAHRRRSAKEDYDKDCSKRPEIKTFFMAFVIFNT